MTEPSVSDISAKLASLRASGLAGDERPAEISVTDARAALSQLRLGLDSIASVPKPESPIESALNRAHPGVSSAAAPSAPAATGGSSAVALQGIRAEVERLLKEDAGATSATAPLPPVNLAPSAPPPGSSVSSSLINAALDTPSLSPSKPAQPPVVSPSKPAPFSPPPGWRGAGVPPSSPPPAVPTVPAFSPHQPAASGAGAVAGLSKPAALTVEAGSPPPGASPAKSALAGVSASLPAYGVPAAAGAAASFTAPTAGLERGGAPRSGPDALQALRSGILDVSTGERSAEPSRATQAVSLGLNAIAVSVPAAAAPAAGAKSAADIRAEVEAMLAEGKQEVGRPMVTPMTEANVGDPSALVWRGTSQPTPNPPNQVPSLAPHRSQPGIAAATGILSGLGELTAAGPPAPRPGPAAVEPPPYRGAAYIPAGPPPPSDAARAAAPAAGGYMAQARPAAAYEVPGGAAWAASTAMPAQPPPPSRELSRPQVASTLAGMPSVFRDPPAPPAPEPAPTSSLTLSSGSALAGPFGGQAGAAARLDGPGGAAAAAVLSDLASVPSVPPPNASLAGLPGLDPALKTQVGAIAQRAPAARGSVRDLVGAAVLDAAPADPRPPPEPVKEAPSLTEKVNAALSKVDDALAAKRAIERNQEILAGVDRALELTASAASKTAPPSDDRHPVSQVLMAAAVAADSLAPVPARPAPYVAGAARAEIDLHKRVAQETGPAPAADPNAPLASNFMTPLQALRSGMDISAIPVDPAASMKEGFMTSFMQEQREPAPTTREPLQYPDLTAPTQNRSVALPGDYGRSEPSYAQLQKQAARDGEMQLRAEHRDQLNALPTAPGMTFRPAAGKMSAAVRAGEVLANPPPNPAAAEGTPAWLAPLSTIGGQAAPGGVTAAAWSRDSALPLPAGRFPRALPTWVWARVLPCLDVQELLQLALCSRELAKAALHEPLWRSLYIGKRCWRPPGWLWAEKGAAAEPKSWREAYKARHAVTRPWVKLWEAEERFLHGPHGAAASLSSALVAAKRLSGGLVHAMAPWEGEKHMFDGALAVYQVRWAPGAPGVRPSRVSLQQALDLVEPGETLLLAPGAYRSESPVRVTKPLVVRRDPRFGPNVASSPGFQLPAYNPATKQFTKVQHALTYGAGAPGMEQVPVGPQAAGPAVLLAPFFQFGGGYGHAGWKGGGSEGGPHGGGGAGGGLGALQGLTFVCQHFSAAAHCRMDISDCEIQGHLQCFEGCAPLVTYSRLRSVMATDDSAPELHSCKLNIPGPEGSAFRADSPMAEHVERVVVRATGRTKMKLHNCDITMSVFEDPAVEVEFDAMPEIKDCTIEGHAGIGVRCNQRSRPRLTGNAIGKCGQQGMILCGNTEALVESNQMHGNKNTAVHCLGDCRPTLEENSLFMNEQAGLLVSGRARPVMRLNKVQGNQGPGVVVNGEGGGSYVGNVIQGNQGPGITVSGTAEGTFEGNKIQLNQASGVMIWGEAAPELNANTVHENKEAGVCLGESVIATVTSNTIFKNGGCGAVYGDQAGGLCHGNEFKENKGLGLLITGKARPDLRENQIKGNMEGGVNSDDPEALKSIKDLNYIFANGEGGNSQDGNCAIM